MTKSLRTPFLNSNGVSLEKTFLGKLKNIALITLVLLSTIGGNFNSVKAQAFCNNPLGSLSPSMSWQYVNHSSLGYYSFNATAGCTYRFTYCSQYAPSANYSGDPYLTISTAPTSGGVAASDDHCGLGSYISWTAPSTATYYVNVGNCCSSQCGNHGARNLGYCSTNCAGGTATPSSITASSQTVCLGNPTTLTVQGGQGTTYWFTGSCSTVGSIGTGATLTVNPNATTTYFARNFNNGIWSPSCASTTITVTNGPAAPTSNPVTVNCGNTATLAAAGGNGSYVWYSNAAGTNQVGTGASFVTPVLTSNTTYYVASSSGAQQSLTQTYNINSTAQLINSGSSCGGGSFYNGCSAVQSGWNWTDNIPAGAVITNVQVQISTGVVCTNGALQTYFNNNAGPTFTPNSWCNCSGSNNGIFTINYPAAQYVIGSVNTFRVFANNCFGFYNGNGALNGLFGRVTVNYTLGSSCVSNLVAVPVTVNSNVAQPAISGTTTINCGQTASLTAVGGGGNTYTWFSNAAATTQIGTGASYTSPALTASTTYYVVSSTGSANGTVYTFTNCSATGQFGPTQAQVNSAYSSTNLAGLVTSSSGIQLWTVPTTGTYRIEAFGAQGGGNNQFGRGAQIRGDFALNAGQQLKILVGQSGGVQQSGSGGGGSFVATSANVPLIVAGGGGGQYDGGSALFNAHAVTVNNGQGTGCTSGGVAGAGGSGCNSSGASGGGGFNSNGGGGSYGSGGLSFTNGGNGGNHGSYAICVGGFGGGGGTHGNTGGGGGGGGYSGGAGGYHSGANGSGGGGGSYNNGTNQVNTGGVRTGHGQVIITALTTPCASAAVPVTVTVNPAQLPASANQNINCQATATLTASSNSPLTWFSDAAGTVQVGSGASFTTPALAANTTYYVGAGSGACASQLLPVTVSVNQAQAPTAANQNINCQATATLTASGNGTIYWFSNAAGSTQVGTGASFTTPSLTANTTYYIQAGTGACASALVPVTVNVALPASPSATASAAVVNCGQTSVLSAAGGGGNFYTWYSDAAGTQQVGTGASFTTPVLGQSATYYVTAGSQTSGNQTFNFTGGAQTFTAPATGTYTFDVRGARGGNVTTYYPTNGGLGGRAQGTINLTAGQTIQVNVGGQGPDRLGNHPYGGCTFTAGGWNGGGANRSAGNGTPGGGASDIRVGGNALGNRVIVAGGGGGCGWTYAQGGNGGGTTGAAGANNPNSGGTQGNGGAVGNSGGGCGQSAGSLGQGGDGSGSSAGGGGGGGGYYGGGGGGYNQGGGGGSSYIGGVANGSTTAGFQNGAGQIIISWAVAGCQSQLVPVAISVNGPVAPTSASAVVNCGQTAALTAVGGGGNTYNWFSNAAASTQVGTGASFTTPQLNATTTYYVTSSTGAANGNVYTFTNCSATGQFGPTQAQVNSAYSSTNLAGLVTSSSGIQLWTVPTTGTYRIEAFGAQGGGNNQFGRGAQIRGDFALNAGQQLKILVGQSGGVQQSGSGGGGSFVATSANVPLIVAGGGGGQYDGGSALFNAHAVTVNNGQGTGCTSGGVAGAGGSGCNNSGASGGGGFNSNGGGGSYGSGGLSFTNGGNGGNHGSYAICVGGFGGGGGTHGNTGGGGGGGGYSGGAGGYHNGSNGSGGGGGSYNNGTNQVNTGGVRTGHGQVIITSLTTPCASAAIPVTVTVNPIAAPVVAGNTTLCGNNNTVLTASGSPSGYVWYANANATGQLGANAAYTTPNLNSTTTYYVQSSTPQGGSQTFNFTGAVQTFTAPVSGTYTLEGWGAQGGNDPSNPNAIFGGRGGYAKGDVYLSAGTTINVFVGGQGTGCLGSSWRSTGGGGATDFRLVGGNWNDNAGLYSRILVAGGGGGRHGNNYEGVAYVGNDGGGASAPNFNANGVNVIGSTVNSGGSSNNTNVPGSFGFSNPTPYSNNCSTGGWNGGARGSDNWANGGGGGGWYGGVSSWPTGSGGSSYAYTAASWIPGGYTPTAAYQLTNTQLISGNTVLPNPSGGTMTGRSGNGIAKITWTGTGCVSVVTPVTVTVNAIPAAPSANSPTICAGQPATIAASANCNWYTVPNGGASIGQTQNYTTAPLNNNVTYYMEGVSGPCLSPTRTAVTVTVNATPASNSGSSITGAVTCGKNSVLLGGNALAAGQNGTWTLVSGTNANAVWSLQTSNNTTFTGSYGGTYVLNWAVQNASTGCIGNDTMVVTFNQPIDVALIGMINTNALLWGGLTGTDWSTSTNWYQKQAAGHYIRLSGAVQPVINNEVFTVNQASGGVCIGNNTPTLSLTSNAEDVYVGPGVNLNLTNDSLNIAQNLINNGSITASTGLVNFTGTTNATISGSGTTQLFNMRVNKSSGATLTLQQPVSVTNVLTMNQGNVFTTAANLLTLGSSSAAPGSLSYNTGTIVGPFKRFFASSATAGNDGFFPVGTATYNRYADIAFANSPGVNQELTIEYVTGAPLQGGVPLYNGLPLIASGSLIQNYSADGYWSVLPTAGIYNSSITSTNYNVTLFANNLTGMQTPQICRIIKSAGSNTAAQNHVAWSACGTHAAIPGNANPTAFAITSTATQGFSWFNVGTPNSQALPVELLSFNGNCESGTVSLTWQTATEHNSDYFNIEKSRDGQNWQLLTSMDAAGNSTQLLNYATTDENAMEGNNYYRLVQVDMDGTTKEYDVINVSCAGGSKGYFTAYPNPSTGAFQVVLNDKNLVGKGTLMVKDTKGAMLLNRSIEVKPGINMFGVTDLNLAPGVYYIQIINGERATDVLKEVIR